MSQELNKHGCRLVLKMFVMFIFSYLRMGDVYHIIEVNTRHISKQTLIPIYAEFNPLFASIPFLCANSTRFRTESLRNSFFCSLTNGIDLVPGVG